MIWIICMWMVIRWVLFSLNFCAKFPRRGADSRAGFEGWFRGLARIYDVMDTGKYLSGYYAILINLWCPAKFLRSLWKVIQCNPCSETCGACSFNSSTMQAYLYSVIDWNDRSENFTCGRWKWKEWVLVLPFFSQTMDSPNAGNLHQQTSFIQENLSVFFSFLNQGFLFLPNVEKGTKDFSFPTYK